MKTKWICQVFGDMALQRVIEAETAAEAMKKYAAWLKERGLIEELKP